MFCYIARLSLEQSYSKSKQRRREGNNCSIVSRSGYIWVWSEARDQESTNHGAHFVEWKSSYITIPVISSIWKWLLVDYHWESADSGAVDEYLISAIKKTHQPRSQSLFVPSSGSRIEKRPWELHWLNLVPRVSRISAPSEMKLKWVERTRVKCSCVRYSRRR